MATQNSSAMLSSLEDTLKVYFVDKAPFQLPKGAKEAIVQFAPWIIIVLLLLALPGLLALAGLAGGAGAMMLAAGQSMNAFWWVSVSIGILSLVLEGMAVPGLFAKTMQGWRLIFYAQLLSIVASLLMMNIVGAILSAVIGFYILFQVRDMYR